MNRTQWVMVGLVAGAVVVAGIAAAATGDGSTCVTLLGRRVCPIGG